MTTKKSKKTLRFRVLSATPKPGEEGLHAREIAKLARVDYKQAVGVLAQLAPSGVVERTAPNTYRLQELAEVIEGEVTRFEVAVDPDPRSMREYKAAQKNGKPDQATVVASMLRMLGNDINDQDVEMALALNDLVQKWPR